MPPADHHLLRHPPPDRSGTGTRADTSRQQRIEDERPILCRRCGHPVTRASERISVDGAHAHTFANPGGIVYEIGCFRAVFGCGYAGPASDEFTWFAGYRWKVAFCGGCLAHLGWLFVPAQGGNSFAGLILDRLLQPD